MPITYTQEGHISNVRAESIAEAKLIVKELKLKKREYLAAKKAINADLAQVRANARSAVTSVALPVRLSGTMGKISRGIAQASRTTIRSQADGVVRGLEAKRRGVEEHITRIDSCVVQLERYILDRT